ncbi:MAG TPA: NAD(P)-dependent oxidoreductase [Burkholderiales bacterium]|nr:NAD(P)-dependent oxidoreductase [Burkholderiales bacterium]
MSSTIGFIGLGQMGEPMARNLIQAGFRLRVYNRSADKTAALVAAGAAAVARPLDAVEAGGIAVSMVANDEALEAVAFGDGGFGAALGQGGIHISMSTVSPETARRLAALHRSHGSDYLAAPVFGRPEAAAARKLWICESGTQTAKARARPVLEALGQAVYDLGEDPAGANVVKLAGNFLILSAVEAMAEAFTLAQKNGVDPATLAKLFGETLFACPIYQNYGRIIAAQAYEPAGFRLALGMKDIKLVLGAAEASTAPMPIASLLHDRLLSAFAKNRQDLDWTAIALGTKEDAGLA